MQFRLTLILFLYWFPLVSADNDDWKQNIEYFESVQLDCAKFNREGTILSVQAWILPSGEIRETQEPVNDKHVYITDNGFSLRIDRLDDPDFGIYYCIVDKGVNSTGVIKIGVNVDGAYYSPAFLRDLRDGAKVGGIAAGCALIVLIFLWIFCKYLSRKRSRLGHKRRENVQLHDIVEAEKGGDDSVYYIADGIAIDNVPELQKQESQQLEHRQISPEQNRADRLSSSTSDHYHSIGTLEKVKSNNDEGCYDNTAF